MAERVAVVTGSNKGIGLSIVKLLCQQNPSWKVYLTARNVDLGKAALEELKKELKGSQPLFHQLDITSKESCEALAQHLKKEHGGLDVLVNNAGIAYKQDSTAPFSEQASVTIETNYFGAINISNALFPLLRKHARVVHVSSTASAMAFAKCSPANQEIIKKFATIDEVTALLNKFIDLAKSGKHEEAGFPNSAYGMSKVGMTALSLIQQREVNKTRPDDDIAVNACCPGYVNTDMSSHKGTKTPDEGADTPVYLATLPEGCEGPKGRFVRDREIKDYV